MVREKWEEILAYYKTYISIIQPLLREARVIIMNSKLEELLNTEFLLEIVDDESKRTISKVKAIAEFNAFFRKEIFRYIINYVQETKNNLELIDIRDNIIDFLDEAVQTFEILIGMVEEDAGQQQKSLLFQLFHPLIAILLPGGSALTAIYDQLLEKAPEWYECQRYILQPATFYRETLEENTIPGISPKLLQIINQITSLFNLDPNYMDLEGDPDTVIPTVLISDVFEPYIDQIAVTEQESIKKVCQRMELQTYLSVFIGPTKRFIELVESHNFLIKQSDLDGKSRWIPQFSNETLILLYLASVSFRRGFLSKELVNWIAMNVAFIIYSVVLHVNLSDENIFYNLFLDMKTEEKILPYLMKLLCFDQYLRLDRMKIRDSPTFRKEIFTFLGTKIEAIDKLTYFLAKETQPLFQKYYGEE